MSAFETLQFHKAKTGLSAVMSEVVREHRPQLVVRGRKEQMLLVEADDIAAMLSAFRFQPRVALDGGEVTLRLEQLGVLGFGASLDEALEDLARELRAYAARFFDRYSFYRHTDRADHAPWLLRFAVTPEEHQLDLIRDGIRDAAEREREAALVPR